MGLSLLTFLLLNVVLYFTAATNCNKYLINQTYLAAHNAYHELLTDQTSPTTTLGDVYIPANVYDNRRNVSQLLDYGVRGLELDIYPKGPGTNFPATFSVEHTNMLDTKSSCDTLSTCLAEINGFLVANEHISNPITIGPVLLRFEAKLFANNLYSMADLLEIQSTIADTLDKKYLFTPQDFGAKATQEHWPNFRDICLEAMANKIIVIVSTGIIDILYPNAKSVATNNNAQTMEKLSPMFAFCRKGSDSRYCSINSEIENADDHYLYLKSISTLNGGLFIQPNTLSPVDNFIINNGKIQITEALYNRAYAELASVCPPLVLFAAQLGLTGAFELPLKTWNAYEDLAYVDAHIGNKDAKLDLTENIAAGFYVNGRNNFTSPLIIGLFTTPVIFQVPPTLGFFLQQCNYGTIDGKSIYDPIAWLLVSNAFEFSAPGLVPNIDVLAIEGRTCAAFEQGYQYIFGDYLFSDGVLTNYPAFTVENTLNSGASNCLSPYQTFNFRNQ